MQLIQALASAFAPEQLPLWVGCGNWGFLSVAVDAKVILSGKCRPEAVLHGNTYKQALASCQ